MSQTVSFRLQDNDYEELQKAATAEKAASVGDYAKALTLNHVQGRSSQLSNIEERLLKTERLMEELRRDFAVSVKALLLAPGRPKLDEKSVAAWIEKNLPGTGG